MRRLLGTALIATIAALSTPLTVAAATSPNATTMTTAKVKAAGISLAYPSTWTVGSPTKRGFAAQVKLLAKKNPKLAAVMSSADTPRFKFYAIDGAAALGLASNVNVLSAGDVGTLTLADFKAEITQMYKGIGATVIDVKAVKVSGKTAYRADTLLPITHPDGTTVVTHVGQLLVLRDGSGTIVSVTSSNDDAGAALIDSMIANVHLI